MKPIKLDCKLVQEIYPVRNYWTKKSFTEQDVLEYVDSGELIPPSLEWKLEWPRYKHLQKIAWFVVHGIDSPIDVDVGVYSLSLRIDDGHHRYWAACIRGDEYILANCNGCVKLISRLKYKRVPNSRGRI